MKKTTKVFGFAGYSGSGKTSLIEQVIPLCTARGMKVSLIKHVHHRFDIDRPGKDSYRHREAGCTQVLVTSGLRWALMHELRGAPEPTLEEQLALMAPCDLVLVEGFKDSPVPKIEVYRPTHGGPPLFPSNPSIVAVATDGALVTQLPQLDLNNPTQVAEFMLGHLGMLS